MIVSPESSLAFWEIVEYIAEAVVIIGAAGEGLGEFTNLLGAKECSERKDRILRISTIVLIIGLAVELGGLIRTNDLSGQIVARAVLSAGTARGSAGAAVADAGRAKVIASDAETLAHGARKEADSFEKDIVSAKSQAAEAESHLADALQRAANAAAELDRLKSPRTLTNVGRLISTLSEFRGTEYTFSAVYANDESLSLLKIIDNALQLSGWKRGKPISGFPSIDVFGKDNPYPVPQALNKGIRISVDWPGGITDQLKSLNADQLPEPLKAAVYLNLALFSSVSPQEETPEKKAFQVNIETGDSKEVRISVGEKP